MFDKIVLLLTGLTAIYALVRLWGRYSTKKETYDVYYLMGYAVLLVSGLLLIFLGYGILGMGGTTLSPYILPGLPPGRNRSTGFLWALLNSIILIGRNLINGSH